VTRPFLNRGTVALVLATFVVAACGGGNNEDATPSLDAAAYQRGYDQLGTMLDRASTGDVEGAEEAFAQVVPLTRLVGEALASLPQEVITRAALVDAATSIELELADKRRADVLAGSAKDARQALADAAEALGVQRPHDQQDKTQAVMLTPSR
jgi:hypothetical protein